ncbi:hypothetical protein UFOVP434_68 [uncultured Caudovirales phage]|uniref:Uncharacterized protein n=1 Tax=uncultured Caudovirales phage TaxID=2100421 RepID=A0A6J5MDD5_9CAUD|nr:hypothetical protein UFOVP434_68 [uncultured Caudovirales phage]
MKKYPVDYSSSDTNDLIYPFRIQIEKVIKNLVKKKINAFPVVTLEGPLVQARKFCAGRTNLQISTAIEGFSLMGCPNLQKIMEIAFSELRKNRKIGQKLTNNLPGQSWHQWGEAVDFELKTATKKSSENTDILYKNLQIEAEALNLTCGNSSKKLSRLNHLQLSTLPSPNHSYHFLDKQLLLRFDF